VRMIRGIIRSGTDILHELVALTCIYLVYFIYFFILLHLRYDYGSVCFVTFSLFIYYTRLSAALFVFAYSFFRPSNLDLNITCT